MNELVKKGMPFRDAYRKVGEDIAAGNFTVPRHITYTHEGSIGNLQNAEIKREMKKVMNRLSQKFRRVFVSEQKLLSI